MERVHGQPLDIMKLSKSPPETQRRFFASLIAVLRRLDFDAAGSLMPSGRLEGVSLPGWLRTLFSPRVSRTKPVVVDAISIPVNELYIQGGRAVPPRLPSPPTSTTQFIDAGFRLLRDTYLMPKQDLSENGARSEVFALYTLELEQMRLPQPHEGCNAQPERFVLTHTDLRGPNIMVDDVLRIQAVIDWEWAVTVPAAFIAPPSWLYFSKAMLDEFYSTLASLPLTQEPSVALLQRQWLPADGDDSHHKLHMAHIFESPYNLNDVFYDFIHPQLFDVPRMETLRTFSLQPHWQEKVKQRVESSERYTQYLKANNLYEVDEEAEKRAQQRRDLVAQAQAYLVSLNIKT